MILFVFLDFIPILIGFGNTIINFFLDDIFNLSFTVCSIIYRYRLLITRTNNYFIASLFLFLLLINSILILFSILVDSIIYIDITIFRLSSNRYWILTICWSFRWSWSFTISGGMYNRRTYAHKVQWSPQQYTCCTYTQFTDTKSLLNSSNNSISHSSLPLFWF